MKTAAVLLSIQPKWCNLIIDGKSSFRNKKKTIEVRKTRPKIETPFKCYMYCSKAKNKNDEYWIVEPDFVYSANGSVIGEFICDSISSFDLDGLEFYQMKEQLLKLSFLTETELRRYAGEKICYGWHISNLKIYDKPKELRAFRKTTQCPQARYSEIVDTWYCDDGYTKSATVDKTQEFPFNEECIYFYNPPVGGETDEYEDYAYCMCKGYKPLTRPPQSWCYVEEPKCNMSQA